MLFHSFDNPRTELYWSDCRTLLTTTQFSWKGLFRFVFADPPFNIGQNYSEYKDSIDEIAYLDFSRLWISQCTNLLCPGGVLAIHVPDDLVHLVLTCAKENHLQRIAWVIWHYRFGQCQKNNWINSKCHCLIFKEPSHPHVFNSAAVLVASDRASKYGDPRTQTSETPGQRVPLDVWSVENDGAYWGRVQGNSQERRENHPNQLPEKYLERLILAYTRLGEYVFDPFAGSGTTAVVARALNRPCITCEVSEISCVSIVARVSSGAVRIGRI